MKSGTEVKVYMNLPLTKRAGRPVYSVLERRGGSWLLAGHRKVVRLRDVTFEVSEAGRQRVLEEKSKNVHAFVRGTLDSSVRAQPNPVTYNPYVSGEFRRRSDNEPVHGAREAFLGSRGVAVN